MVEPEYILTEGFEDSSPDFLANKINNFIKENDIRNIIDIKYSSFKKDGTSVYYSAIIIFNERRNSVINLQYDNQVV
jgi:hypothetical protein